MSGDEVGIAYYASVALRIFTFLAAAYHAYRVARLWGDRRGGQRLQNLILAMVFVIGTFAIMASGFREILGPQWTPVARFIGAIATGALFVGMATITLTWLLDGALKDKVDRASDPRTRE